MRDLMNHINLKRALSPVAALTNANTPFVSQIIDCQGINALVFAILVGANTDADATFTALLEHGDVSNLSDAAAVPDDQLNGTEVLASFTAADNDNAVFKLGYRGTKRYVRLTITPAANGAGDAFVAAVAITLPNILPAANPPA